MIIQTYIYKREISKVIVKGKEVYYQDRKMEEPTRMIPMDNRIRMKIIKSRNKIDPKLLKQFELTAKEKKEYEEAIKQGKDIEEKLAEICKKDCKKNKLKLLKEEKEDGDNFGFNS